MHFGGDKVLDFFRGAASLPTGWERFSAGERARRRTLMKPYFTTSLLLVALATPALAAEHFAVVDTVGNCSVIDTKPSPYNISGLKVLGDQSGAGRREGSQLRQLAVQ